MGLNDTMQQKGWFYYVTQNHEHHDCQNQSGAGDYLPAPPYKA